jgi:hypothetical protein
LRIALPIIISKISTYSSLSEYYKKKDLLANNYAKLGYNAATTLRIPNKRLECLQLLIELNTGATAKNYALQYLHLMIASPRLGKEQKSVC